MVTVKAAAAAKRGGGESRKQVSADLIFEFGMTLSLHCLVRSSGRKSGVSLCKRAEKCCEGFAYLARSAGSSR
jgi:hypothetical protein